MDSKIATTESLEMVRTISKDVMTFHHHYHILYDLARDMGHVNYLEIGTWNGASACLMLQRPDTSVVTIDTGEYVKKDTVISNLNKFNIYNNFFCYLESDSHQPSTRVQVKRFFPEGVDILLSLIHI